MRLQDKRSFKGINFDDADEYLEDGDTRNMLNVRVGYSESGDDGIIENVKGTISLFSELSFSLPGGTNKCVGTCTDDQNNRLIWFNWNQYSNHGIYCYNTDLNTIQTVLISSSLNFQGSVIHSIDILNNILAWTDAFNRPRSISVTHGLAGIYAGASIEELINDAKIVPMLPPVCTPNITKSSTYIQTLRSFQFIYRYVFIDGEKGAWSSVSRIVATAFRNEHIDHITLDVSGCELFTVTAIRPVISYIELASRELYTFNFNQFLRITTADLVLAGGLISYTDTESKTPLDPDTDTNIAFFENPIKAETVAFQNDRKFYATCTEGYDAFGLSTSGVSTSVIPQLGGIPYLSDCDTHGNERYLKPDSTYNYSVAWHDEYGRKSGAIDLPQLVIKTQPQVSNDYKANVLNFSVDLSSVGSYPTWAKKIEILRSDNQSVSWFVQGRVNNVFYCTGYDSSGDPIYIKNPGQTPPLNVDTDWPNISDSGAIEIHVDISNWLQYKINIGYTFSEGDRVTFLTMGDYKHGNDVASTLDLRNLRVKALRGSLLIVDYIPIGRNDLNDIAMSNVSINNGFVGDEIWRFIVGDNGTAFYSYQTAANPPGPTTMETDFVAGSTFKMPGLYTTNNLYSVSLVYPAVVNPVVSVYITGANGFFTKATVNEAAGIGGWSAFGTIPTGTTEDINCIESDFTNHNNTDLIMVGNGGLILKYNIASNIVTQQSPGITSSLNFVFRITGTSTLVAVGDDGVILKTTNNGSTWAQVSAGLVCQNLNCVYLNGVNGCIVGDEGVILVSNNTGATWLRVDTSVKINLNSVGGEGSADNHVYIGGEDGYVAKYSMLLGGTFTTTYTSGTTKKINRLFSFGLPVGQNRAFIVGDTDLLMNVDFVAPLFHDNSSVASGLYGTRYLNYAAKMELFSPKTFSGPVVYYEVGDAYKVGQSYSFTKGKGNDGDVYLITKDFQGNTGTPYADEKSWTLPGEFIFSMTPDSNNTAGVWDKDLGRPNIVLLYPELQQKRNIIRYSDKYVQDSKINGLSNFRELNYELIPNEFGWVRKITPIETMLLINAERETATAHIDQTIFNQANGQEVAAISDKVINNVRKLAGSVGCTNPESISMYLGQIYWYSYNRAIVCRYNNSNGIFPISEYKARTYFYALNNGVTTSSTILGGFEPKFKNYLLTASRLSASSLDVSNTFYTVETANITANTSPSVGAISPVNNYLYVPDQGANKVTVIDTNSNTKITDISVGAFPYFALAAKGYIYVSNFNSNTVSVINPNTNTVIVTLGVGINPQFMGTNLDQSKVYVNGQFDMSISVIETATNTISSVITIPLNPRWTVVASNGNVYSGSFNDNRISVINGNTDTFTGTITVGYDPYYLFLVNGYLYSVNRSSASLSQIDINTNTVINTIPLPNTATPYWLSYNPNTKLMYITDLALNVIYVVDYISNTLVTTINSSGSIPIFSVYSQLHDYIFVTNNGTGTIDVIDSRTNTIIDTLTADAGTTFALQSSNGNLYFSNNLSNTVTYLSYKRLPETIAFQEVSNRWVSKYSFIPEIYGHVKTDMFSFKSGELWKHDASPVYNNFHGTQYTSQVNPVFNKEPSYQKSFNSLSLESQKVWSAISITTPEGQASLLSGVHFEQINKEWWADILQDTNTPNMVDMFDALFNGDFMQSNVLNVVLESTLSDATKLRFANLYSIINQRTNK